MQGIFAASSRGRIRGRAYTIQSVIFAQTTNPPYQTTARGILRRAAPGVFADSLNTIPRVIFAQTTNPPYQTTARGIFALLSLIQQSKEVKEISLFLLFLFIFVLDIACNITDNFRTLGTCYIS